MRTEQLYALRSEMEIPLDVERSSLELEQFQNECLRPILKFQHAALLRYFMSQSSEAKYPPLEKDLENFVRVKLQKEMVLRNVLMGMILGLMSVEEIDFFARHKSELSRRLVNMLVQRLTDGIPKTCI
ncbi:MAG: glyoxalase [Bacteroidia bacterium]|nr:glyoxalase [Bacteroidia bacterium]